ncbi:glycoside hydrolase family 28 protein [Aspergillus tanneri]|nr:uncharacterized protein ATNIH1004_000111 [Aspergillus tanneri]KAA8651233.1 hypothetical protein ATNIH1004_000111 [Aspergillus tanneri]
MRCFQPLGLASIGSLVSAAPALSLTNKTSSCTIISAEATSNVSGCSTIIVKDVKVPAGQTLDLSKVDDGATITFEGTTTFGYKEWKGPLIRIEGKGITVNMAQGALIDGDGSRWWDTKGSNGGKTKPKFLYAHKLEDSTISGLTIKNTPIQAISVQATNTLFENIHIDNSDGDNKGGHNTDAFDVGGSDNVWIRGAVVNNQDDCLAINSGRNIEFSGATCSGGHGISIGSIGGRDDNTVKNVTIFDSTVTNSDNGIRIKTIVDETGVVSDVNYSSIQLSKIHKNGIVIQQDYKNGGPTGKPSNKIPITGITLNGITGSVDAGAIPIYVLCGEGSCTNWKWTGVNISGGKRPSCKNQPSGASC